MKTMCAVPAAPLNHLTALHLLGRMLASRDEEDGCSHGPNRYQVAVQQLSQALDQVEQTCVVRQVLEANPAQPPSLAQGPTRGFTVRNGK